MRKILACPLIYSKVRSSPVLAFLVEACCNASHSFLSTYLLAGKFITTFLPVVDQSL